MPPSERRLANLDGVALRAHAIVRGGCAHLAKKPMPRTSVLPSDSSQAT